MEDKFQWYKPGFIPALLFLTGSMVLSFSLTGDGDGSNEVIQVKIVSQAALFVIFFLLDEGLLGLGLWNFAAPLAALEGGNRFCHMLNNYWYKTHGFALRSPVSFPVLMWMVIIAAVLAAFALNRFLRRAVPSESQALPLLSATMAKSSWVYWERVEAKWMDGILALILLWLFWMAFTLNTLITWIPFLTCGILLLPIIGGFHYSISRESIRLRWGWARIPLLNLQISDVDEVESMESGVFAQFGGFGIRYSVIRGWGFVLRNNAVCIKTGKGRRVAFSAGNPTMVAELIKSAMQQTRQTGTGAREAESPRHKPLRRRILPAVIIIFAALAVFLAAPAVVYMAYKEPGVVFESNAFKLKGLYGVNIPLTEIAETDLIALHEMPRISIRTNGISSSKVHRGHFRTTAGENIRLSINSGSNPVIRIVDRHGNAYYINRKNADETRQIFDRIRSNRNK